MYQVREIKTRKDLADCPIVSVTHALWDKNTPPAMDAQLGCSKEQGLWVKLIAFEGQPLRRYTQPQDPVYLDSAMEFFFTLDPVSTQQSMYCNFEINANGAMLADWGEGRENRQPILEKEYQSTQVTATLHPKHWTVEFCIPHALMNRVFGKTLQVGDIFSFNLYKISEDPSIEHYASLFPVKSPTPNFHRPQDFGPALVVAGE